MNSTSFAHAVLSGLKGNLMKYFWHATISDQGLYRVKEHALIGLDSLKIACCPKRVKRCVPLHCGIALVTNVPCIMACHFK